MTGSHTTRRRGACVAGQDLRSNSSCQKNPVPVFLTDSSMWSRVYGYRHDGIDVSDAGRRKPPSILNSSSKMQETVVVYEKKMIQVLSLFVT